MIIIAVSVALVASTNSAAAQTGPDVDGQTDEIVGVDGPVDAGDDISASTDSAVPQTCVEEGENLGTLALGSTATVERSGQLSDGDCRATPVSWWSGDRWVDRFVFELNERGLIRIDLIDTSGSFDPYLVLNQDGRQVGINDDGGSGLNALLWRDLSTGAYQIVVTDTQARDASTQQEYRLTVSLAAPCEPERLGVVEDVSGTVLSRTGEFVASGCIVETHYGTHSPGAVYLFELAEPRSVRIDLHGLDGVNSHLRLKDLGANWVRAIDDDAGPGRDASIRSVLPAGEYRIEAGSVSDNEGAGRYRLALTVDAAPSCEEDRLGVIHGTIVRSGEFGVGGCITDQWGSSYLWSGVHVFSLAEPGRIRIDLEGLDGVDPILWLTDEQGRHIASDWDGGAGRDSRIERELAAGTYRISAQRASGYQREAGGRYRLTIDATSQPVPISLNAGRIVVRRATDGRTEFGWLPQGAAERILPDSRYLGLTAPVDRWLNSSPVEVAGVEIGRINVRLLADGRVEFGFTPTNGERILPSGRFLRADPPIDRWLPSTEIELPRPREIELPEGGDDAMDGNDRGRMTE